MSKLFALLTALAAHPPSPAQGEQAFSSWDDFRAYLAVTETLSTSGQITMDQIPRIREAGFEVVVNLAPADDKRNHEEGFRVTREGMTYVQIPVSWQEPDLRDLQLFFDILDANQDRKVFVHCFANMRVSVFVFLYRTLRLHAPQEEALADLYKIWNPDEQPQWTRFIQAAQEKFSH